MKFTDNFSLLKPDPTDVYNIEDFNKNMDVIDEELKMAKDVRVTSDRALLKSRAGGLKVNKIIGKSEQRLNVLKNLFSISTASSTYTAKNAIVKSYYGAYDMSFNIDANNIFVTNDGVTSDGDATAYVSTKITVKPNTDYSLSWSIKDLANDAGYVMGMVSVYSEVEELINEALEAFSFNSGESSTIEIRFNVYNGEEKAGAIYFQNIMLELGAEVTSYEPYRGTKTEPSPAYPQAINNTFDCVELQKGYYRGAFNGLLDDSDNFVCTKYKIPCVAGDSIFVGLMQKLNIFLMWYDAEGNMLEDSLSTSYTYLNRTNVTVVAPTNTCYFTVSISKDGGLTTDSIGKVTLTVAGKYVTQLVVHGKNLLASTAESQLVNYRTFAVNEDKTVNIDGIADEESVVELPKFTLKAGEYILSGGISEGVSIVLNDGLCTDTGEGTKFTLEEETVITVSLKVDGGVSVSGKTFKPMIREANIEDDTYEPYTEQVVTMLLDEPLRQDDAILEKDGVWGIERHRGAVTLTGSEGTGWTRAVTRLDTSKYYFFGTLDITASDDSKCLCDIGVIEDANGDIEGAHIFSTNAVSVFVEECATMTVDEFLAWLADNPITIEYELETPVFTALTLDIPVYLAELETYDTVTYPEANSTIKPVIEVEYGQSKIGSYTLKSLLNTKINSIQIGSIFEILSNM